MILKFNRKNKRNECQMFSLENVQNQDRALKILFVKKKVKLLAIFRCFFSLSPRDFQLFPSILLIPNKTHSSIITKQLNNNRLVALFLHLFILRAPFIVKGTLYLLEVRAALATPVKGQESCIHR